MDKEIILEPGKLYYLYAGDPNKDWAEVEVQKVTPQDNGDTIVNFDLLSGESFLKSGDSISQENLGLYFVKHKSQYGIDLLTEEIYGNFRKSGMYSFSYFIQELIKSNVKIFIGNKGWLTEYEKGLYVEMKNENLVAYAPYTIMSNFRFECCSNSSYSLHYTLLEEVLNLKI